MDTDIEDEFLQQYQSCFYVAPPTLQVIGGGKIARVLVQGFVNAGFFTKESVTICANSQDTVDFWNNEGYLAFMSTEYYSRVPAGGVVLICVKPQVFLSGVKTEIFKWLHKFNSADFMVVSVMAGISLETLYEDLKVNVIRMMPNLACGIGEGIVLLSSMENFSTPMDQRRTRLAQTLASKLGYSAEVSQSIFDAATALAASAPAFIFVMIEALADGGVLSGLSREMALKLAANAVKGSAQLYLKTEKPLGQLKDEVCSPAGTTIAGIRQLEKSNVRSALIEAVFASKQRSEELSKIARKDSEIGKLN